VVVTAVDVQAAIAANVVEIAVTVETADVSKVRRKSISTNS
jgi:hypothetical protein